MDTDSMMLSGPASWASTLSSRPPSSDGSHATFPDAPSPEWRPSKQRASPLRQPLPPLLPSSCQTPAIMLPVAQMQPGAVDFQLPAVAPLVLHPLTPGAPQGGGRQQQGSLPPMPRGQGQQLLQAAAAAALAAAAAVSGGPWPRAFDASGAAAAGAFPALTALATSATSAAEVLFLREEQQQLLPRPRSQEVQQQRPRKQQVGGRRRSEASSSDACGPMQRAGDAEAEVLGSHIRKTEQGLIDIGYRKRGRPPKNAAPEPQPAAVPPLWQQISCPTGAAVNGSGAVAAADADAPAPAELPRQLAVKPCVDPPLPIPNHLFEALYSHMVPPGSRKLPRKSPDVATKFQFPASSTFLTPPTRKGPSVTPAKRQYSCPPVHLSSFSRPLGAKEDELAPELIAGGGLCPLDVRESLLGGCWGEGLN